MKIITKTLILLSAALGLPFVTDGMWNAGKSEFVNVSEDTERNFCRLTFDQIANDEYRCRPLSERPASLDD